MKQVLMLCVMLCGLGISRGQGVNARYGMNFYHLKDWNREQPFLNNFKTARAWISQRQGQWDSGEALELDERGYVRRLAPGQWAATVVLTEVTEHFPGGEYVFLYEGEGEFEWKGNARRVSKASGREVIEVTPTGRGFVHFVITGMDEENYPRNFRLVRGVYEDRLARGEVFSPEFLALWRDVDTMRFMDWTQTNTTKLEKWEERPLPEDFTYSVKGVPWEQVIRLCALQRANAWINLPHLADDDFIRRTAEMFRDYMPEGLTVYYELSNEVWNGMFPSARRANALGQELGLASESWRAGALYYARECVRMFTILDAVYEGQAKERYQKVVATQASNIGYARIVLEGSEVYKHADTLAVAPYLTFNVPLTESPWNKKMPNAAEVATWDHDRLFAYMREHSLPDSLRWMDQQMALAKEKGLTLTAYEGGQHLTALGEANRNRELVELLNSANRDPRMGELYTEYLNHWRDIGGGVFCLFNSGQRWTNAGAWGLFEHWGQAPETSPKYMAVRRWVESLR